MYQELYHAGAAPRLYNVSDQFFPATNSTKQCIYNRKEAELTASALCGGAGFTFNPVINLAVYLSIVANISGEFV